MKQTRQIVFILLLMISFYITFFSDQSFIVKAAALTVYLMIVGSVSCVLMLENRSPYKTLLWIYAIFFFPVIGYVYFIYSGQLEVKGHLFKKKRAHNDSYLKELIDNKHSDRRNKLSDVERTISDLIWKKSNFPMSFFSHTRVLNNGGETFSEIKSQLKKAEKYIHMEYYTFRPDDIGNEIIDLLIQKVKEGLEVRVIYDAVGSVSITGEAISRMEAAGIQTACFLPVKYGFFNQKINFRNHRKIIVIDGTTGFVGGLNIGDEYLGRKPKIGFWRDTHLIVKGEALRSLHAVFLVDWAYVNDQALLQGDYLTVQPANEGGGVQVVASGPDTNQSIMGDLYFTMITSAKQSIWIATPYFIPSKAIRSALSAAASKGIDVKLMVPETNDGFLTQYATRSYFGELLNKGIEVYMYRKGFMHQKIMIVDGRFASMGTANVDLRSLHLNFEVSVFLFQTESVDELLNNYETDIKDSQQVKREVYKKRTLCTRMKESFARLFSPVL